MFSDVARVIVAGMTATIGRRTHMSNPRTHYVTTPDGVTIGGTVHGDGPPLVFLQGAIGDGDLDWQALLPHLTDRFTCHLPSQRGRGLSGDHPDLSIGRQIDDVIEYLHSIGEPAGLVGWSGGANFALAAAAKTDAVTAVAAVEPVANSQMDEQERAALGDAVTRAGELTAEGNLPAAMRAFADYPFTDDDITMAEDAGYFEAAGRYAPTMIKLFQHLREHEGPLPDDPTVLRAISVPVLVIHGTNTRPFMTTSVRHVADHVPNATVRAIPDAGHATPLTHPEALAEAFAEFFSPTAQPA